MKFLEEFSDFVRSLIEPGITFLIWCLYVQMHRKWNW